MSAIPTDSLNNSPANNEKRRESSFRQAIYQSMWRWHFYAGIIFAPFLIILAFSGGVYLFKPQIEGYLYKDMLTVREVGASALSPSEIIEKTIVAYPGTTISSITLNDSPEATIMMSTTNNGTSTNMYADPYTGNILGIMNSDETFSAFFKKMHSELIVGGTLGNRLVELAACWAIILLITGLFLWWPRNKSSIWGTILPRLSKPGSRMFWRDIHAVPAFWLSLLLVILIATGLPWSGVLGGQIDKLANSTNTNTPPYAYSFGEKPQSVTVAKDIAEDLPWATQNLPVPISASSDYLPLNIDTIVNTAANHNVLLPYTITLPQGETGVFTLSTSHIKPGKDATLHIDQYSGAILTDVRYADYGVMGKAISLGIAFHEGRLFGLVNQLVGLIACIGLILIAISSYIMWKKRKPKGKLGAPSQPRNKKVTVGLIIIMLICGALMPLVGLSIIIVLLLDLLIIRRIKPLRHWFSS
ncbi:PepSY-associated TM helix domain-containing protein [Paenibacillus endoradicis]|uniref:PepSY-associated TM helix domain-containing protein n=1 Tax=Paenibacillus endoradicis TaxID=2972487 RepID=UPI002158DB4C|nr:PepSY domain-containing protein [Paenibacillus endoradicis]MCR8659580.1 PepSY domain-containing protein [Paenibacillus endoradicis]